MILQLNGRQRYSFALFAIVIACIAFPTSFAGCSGKEMNAPPPVSVTDTTRRDSIASADGITYLALGDSYTIGQNVVEAARYPIQAAAILGDSGLRVNSPDIIATTGWTTLNLLNGIANANPGTDYDLVTLLIGVNDQYQQRDTTGYYDHFTSCLQKAIELANGKSEHVVVLSIPDYSVTPFGHNDETIARQIDQFNQINQSISGAHSISYVDVTAISREVKNDPEMISSDGLHPSGKQYKLWAAALAQTIRKKFR